MMSLAIGKAGLINAKLYMHKNAYTIACFEDLEANIELNIRCFGPDGFCVVIYAGTNFSEIEFTQCLVFFGVKRSPTNTCPRCAPQLAQMISTLLPSASFTRFTAPFISSS